MKSCTVNRPCHFFCRVIRVQVTVRIKKRRQRGHIHWWLGSPLIVVFMKSRETQSFYESILLWLSAASCSKTYHQYNIFGQHTAPSVCYINISFALHPSRLWRLPTSLDRHCPSSGVVWCLAKASPTPDCHFWYIYRHNAETSTLAKAGSKLLVNISKAKLSLVHKHRATCGSTVWVPVCPTVSSSSFPLACPNFAKFSTLQSEELAKTQATAVANSCNEIVTAA